jgi:hypothetical protein
MINENNDTNGIYDTGKLKQLYNIEMFVNAWAPELIYAYADFKGWEKETTQCLKVTNSKTNPNLQKSFKNGLPHLHFYNYQHKGFLRLSAMIEETYDTDNTPIQTIFKFSSEQLPGFKNTRNFGFFSKDSNKDQILYLIEMDSFTWMNIMKKLKDNNTLGFIRIPIEEIGSLKRYNLTTMKEEGDYCNNFITIESLKKYHINPNNWGGIEGKTDNKKIIVKIEQRDGSIKEIRGASIKDLFIKAGHFFNYKNYNQFKKALNKKVVFLSSYICEKYPFLNHKARVHLVDNREFQIHISLNILSTKCTLEDEKIIRV